MYPQLESSIYDVHFQHLENSLCSVGFDLRTWSLINRGTGDMRTFFFLNPLIIVTLLFYPFLQKAFLILYIQTIA